MPAVGGGVAVGAGELELDPQPASAPTARSARQGANTGSLELWHRHLPARRLFDVVGIGVKILPDEIEDRLDVDYKAQPGTEVDDGA